MRKVRELVLSLLIPITIGTEISLRKPLFSVRFMAMDKNASEKTNLHPRNPHRFRYDFRELVKALPELKSFVFVNEYKNETIDFADPDAVKSLNRALLKKFYGISHWDIPENYLCAPIPGRADYIHYAADLLGSSNNGKIPAGENISVLDIGTGANLVYPIIGHKEYGWNFVGSDSDEIGIMNAKKIVDANENLKNSVGCRLQKSTYDIFKGIVKDDEEFDLVVCNPPFHASAHDANVVAERKINNLGKSKGEPVRNFGGQKNELWTPGGEEAFIGRMIQESVKLKKRIFWFTSLVSKKETLIGITDTLKKLNATDLKLVEMAQGQKISRIVAWTFFSEEEKEEWVKRRW
jgi:23S rRNA (adenine1618-N6)-methyltransferase